ncbi:hypothetical protein FUAG_03286 [Fusobacterium ulcerans ATCC 49185]|uniref:DUF3789 domain-containing protein n=1 Tax=Fusobacterium ulcerans TaxID=861 RepID=A0AAX2JA48_9FUSO|nr:hypothetical protein FUAG_03286 [Fusobacterium ulcerans ATCC 49185]SQJ00978.1 Uncharacterised protein [Fusobacterium ulcerans]
MVNTIFIFSAGVIIGMAASIIFRELYNLKNKK